MHGTDAAGVLSWTQAYLRWALAWAGQPVDVATPIVAPPQGQLLAPRIEFVQIMATAEMGMIREARRLALDFAEHAESVGHHGAALHAIHLAGRIQVTRNLVERAEAFDSHVEGDLAIIIRDHLGALAVSDGAGLEKVAERFETSGHLALAHEAFANASKSHVEGGSQRSARRSEPRLVDLMALG